MVLQTTMLDWYGVATILFLLVCLIGGTVYSRRLRGTDIQPVIEKSVPVPRFGSVVSAIMTARRKGLSFFFVGTMLAAQSIDGNSTLGSVSLINQSGSLLSGAIIPVGLALCLILTAVFYGKRLNKMSLLTLPDFYYRMYGNVAETIFSLLMIISFVVLIAGSFAATGYILSHIFHIDFFWGVLLGAILILLYSFSGGLFSSQRIDFFIVILAIVSFWAALFFLVSAEPDAVRHLDYLENLGRTDLGPALFTNVSWSSILVIGLGGIISLDFTERIFSADGKTIRKGALAGLGITLLILAPISILGIASTYLLSKSADPFTVFPGLGINILPFPIGAILLLTVLGASMSTASGAILTISSVLSRNIIQRNIVRRWLKKGDLEERILLVVNRLLILPILGGAFLFAYLIPHPGINLILAFDIVLAGGWAPLTFGLFWKKGNKPAAIVSLVVGSILRLSFFFTGDTFEAFGIQGLESIIPLVISVALFIIVSLLTQKKYPGRYDAIVNYAPRTGDLLKGLDLERNMATDQLSFRQSMVELELEAKEKEKEAKIPKQVKYVIIFFYIGILVGWIVLRITLGVDIPFYVVSSESMVPNLNVRDLVIIKHINNDADDTSFINLKVGDIIVFKTPGVTTEGTHKIIVHRIAEIQTNKYGNRIIQTKGDANPKSIPQLDYPIKESDYIGKVIYVIPHGGALRKL